MKGLMYCYVLEKNRDKDSIAPDYTCPTSLDELVVKPVIIVNRRHNILNDKYLSASDMQEKYAGSVILKRPRLLLQQKKVKQVKQRGDATLDVIKKRNSKHNKVWTSLQRPVQTAQ